MRAFATAVAFALVLALGAGFGLNTVQETAANAFATSSARLDHQERVNDYAREPVQEMRENAASDAR
jgi:hypothetical protein